jgi:hydroxymethylpyrimidine pyrophosphatase-like HAD family hydrolase
MIKRLAAFDFDGTLINSPEKENGKQFWQDKMGYQYPHQGWWGRPESLDLDVFDIKPFPVVLHQLEREQSIPDSYVIVLTSRQEKLRPYVQAVLDKNNIHVDKLDMKYDWKDKGQKILNYIQQFPDITEINVYDDMEEHIIAYQTIKSQIPEHITFNVYHSNNGKLTLVESNFKLIDIIRDEIQKII